MNATTEKSYGYQRAEDLPEGTTLYTILRHVSRSGMSRVIDVVYVSNGAVVRLWVPELGRKMDKGCNGYRSNGAGMDMGFDLVYAIGQAVHGNGYYFSHRWL